MTTPKLIMFDLFGTVVSLARVPHSEIKAYADHIHQAEWSPLVLPRSWDLLPAHEGAREAITLLRKKAAVVTCSNAPLATQVHLAWINDLHFDGIMPLELWQVYKPNPRAYMSVIACLGIDLSEAMMVTANETFGDLEAAKALGIQPCLICDNPEVPRDGVLCVRSIQELYDHLSK